ATHFAARIQQSAHDGDQVRVDAAAIDEERLRRPADAGAAHLCVEGNGLRHAQVRIAIDIHVTVAFQVADDGHPGLLLHASYQTLAATRHDDVQVVRHSRQHVPDRGPVRRRYELDSVRGKSGGAQ